MRKAATFLLIVSSLLFFSCQKTAHYIRFNNSYSSDVNNVVAGSVQFGYVATGNTTDYQLINQGNFTMSGNTSSGQQLTGSGYVKRAGTHHWTLTLNSAGKCSIAEDK